MADYIDPPLEGDPTEKYGTIVAYLQSVWPGWQAADGNLDNQIAIAVADLSASDEQTFSTASTDIFRWFGLNLVPDGQPEEAVAATGTVTIVPGTGAALQTIPAGTTYGVEVAGDVIGFEIVSDQTFASPAVNLTGVDVVADRTGTVGNDLAGALEQIDSLGYVASVTLDAPTSGGLDEEPTPTFLDRLRSLLQLQAPRPITPDNFAVMARNIAGVERALAIDGYDPADHGTYDPADPATWKERFVTVSAIDAAGEDVGAPIRGQINTYFNGDATLGIKGKRETNFVVAVVAPTYTPIAVVWTGVAWSTWAPGDVRAAGDAALAAYLDPSVWGQPTFGEQRGWENLRQVTIDGLYAVLRSVEGLRNVTGLSFGKQVADDFSVDTIGSGAWTVDTGAGSISITGGQLVPSSTAGKGLYRTDVLGADMIAQATFTTGATVASGQWAVRAKRVDGSNLASVRLVEGTGLIVRTLVGGVTTNHTLLAYTPVAGTAYTIRGWIVGNVVTGELYLGVPVDGDVPVASGSYTLTGGDATALGAGVSGRPGISMTPADTAERYDNFSAAALGAGPVTLDGSPGPVLTRAGAMAGAVTS